jgi:hypothetical protein
MLRIHGLAQSIGCVAATAAFATVLMLAQGCSGQKTQIAEDAQSEQLPEVGTLDDYIASQDQYAYVAYGPYDLFMFDPFLFPPYWYPVPVYYLHWHHHHHPGPASAGVGEPLRRGEPPTVATRMAPTTPLGVPPKRTFGSVPGGAMRGSAGFSYGHIGNGAHH